MRHPHGLRAAANAKKALEFVASAQAQVSAKDTTLVVDKPTGTQQGDLMIAIALSDGGSPSWTQPSGWTEVVEQGGIMASYLVAGASEPGNYTFTSTLSRDYSGIIVTYRNAAYDTVGSISTTASFNVMTAPAITLAQSASTLLAFFSAQRAFGTWSSPTSGLASLSTDSDGSNPSWALYSEANVASGSTGGKSATYSGSAGTLGCFLIGIKPS